jgi:predicted lipid-binding transport protein (Tim44 family)
MSELSQPPPQQQHEPSQDMASSATPPDGSLMRSARILSAIGGGVVAGLEWGPVWATVGGALGVVFSLMAERKKSG